MKIQEVAVRRLTGTLATDGPLWEDRLVRAPSTSIPSIGARRGRRAGSSSMPGTSASRNTSWRSTPTRACGASPGRNMDSPKHPLRPVNGVTPLPDAPGSTMALDPDKIEAQEEIRA